MAKGVVKFFNEEKGYGFITNESGKDIFVHANSVDRNTELEAGVEVTFTEEDGRKGKEAKSVRLAK